MPRKQNGFGNPKSLGFKGAGRVDRGKGVGAPGSYPSNRGYGSTVTRTVIEKYNLDSDWVKWRKGYEYYNRAAWYRLEQQDPVTLEYEESQIKSKLYQGTEYEVDVVFDGYKFATKNADSNNHYVMKRTTASEVDLGTIRQVNNDIYKYADNKEYKEIWCKGDAGPDSNLLLQMIGERLTDGETEATLKYLLDADGKPAIYKGKSWEQPTTVDVSIPIATLDLLTDITDYRDLIGKVVYIKNFFVEKDISLVDDINWIDGIDYFAAQIEDFVPNMDIEVLDPGENPLPPTLYDIAGLTPLFKAKADYTVKGQYLFRKADYQRFFGRTYITADFIAELLENISYSVLPFTILGVDVKDGNVLLKSVPFDSEVKFYPPKGDNTLIFTDYSFTKLSIDEYNGRYYHTEIPGEDPWMRLNTDVDPWMDEVFTSGNKLVPATVYTCSCPNHAHAILSAPQATQDEDTRKVNRQRRYPLPTVQGSNDYQDLGRNKAAGKLESWETTEHRLGFKMCKHSIAAMFIEHIKVQEPNKYPTIEAREDFEAKLDKDIAEVGDEFAESYRRGGITTLEVIFALAQGLNLDDVETAYVILNSNF